ncbi:GSCOCG00010136001-RA-CDS [Cotesia congregata]|nr:GSCOCG00010136001-RA-CDS [Cotesia congregata]
MDVRTPEEIKFERIEGPYMCAEGPHWDYENNRLYYVDIIGHKIMSYNPTTRKVTHAYLKCGSVGFAIPVANKKNTFITACGTNLIQVSWDPATDDLDPKVKFISQVDVGVSDTRFNDAKVDPAGRLWAGTMGEKDGLPVSGKGSLYRFDYDGTPKKMISPVDISNGLVWSLNKDAFYYIDSFAYVIDVYDYDDATGDISNRRTLFDLKANNITGIADGMTIDKTGNLWIANHSGGTVFQIDSKTGKLLRTIKMPMRDATSVAFGGPNKDVLYVTSSKDKMPEDLLKQQPLAGSVVAVYGLDCGQVGFAIPLSGRNNTFIAGCKTSIIILHWDPSTNNLNPEYRVISQVDQDISDTRFNDAKVDPRGRLWAGTMGEKNGVPLTGKGSMYKVDLDGTVAKMIDHVDITNKRTIFDLKKNNLMGIPDGMTIDKVGNLWVANHGGGLVLKIDPKTGRLLQSIKMPVTLVTSVAFGGPNKDILYVTSAKDKLNATQLENEPLAGSVFALHDLCISGSPMRSYVMNL